MKNKRILLIITVAMCVMLSSLVGCSFGRQTSDVPDSNESDEVVTLPVEGETVDDASGKEESFVQNQGSEAESEEETTPVPSYTPTKATPQPTEYIPPVTSKPQQEPTPTLYVTQPTPTPQIEQPTPTPAVTEEPPVVDVTPPVYDSSNDLGEF